MFSSKCTSTLFGMRRVFCFVFVFFSFLCVLPHSAFLPILNVLFCLFLVLFILKSNTEQSAFCIFESTHLIFNLNIVRTVKKWVIITSQQHSNKAKSIYYRQPRHRQIKTINFACQNIEQKCCTMVLTSKVMTTRSSPKL